MVCLAVGQSMDRALPSAKLIPITCAAVVTSGQSAVHPRLDAQLMIKEFQCKKALTVEDTCPGVGQDCKTIGADGLSCCGAEHGPGFAFCQTDPDYVCCSG